MPDPTDIPPDSASPGVVTSKNEANPWGGLKDEVRKLGQQYDFFRRRLADRKKQIRLWTLRFLHEERVFDKRTEKQRATTPFVLDPHGYTNIMAMQTHLLDQHMASSPHLKVLGRGFEDQADAALERLTQFDLFERNPAAEWVGGTFRRAAIGGLNINRMRWAEEWDEVQVQPDETDRQEYDLAMAEAEKAAGPSPTEPGLYDEWEAKVRRDTGRPVPPLPLDRVERIANDVGTVIDQVSLDDVEWNPEIPTIEGQPYIWYQNFPRRETLIRLAEAYPDVWDIDAIKAVPQETSASGKSGTDMKRDVMQALGVGVAEFDPTEDVICLRQRWAPREKTLRYVALANNDIPLTKDPSYYPLNIARHPFFGFFNVPTDGASIGVSEYQPNGSLNTWLDQLQSMQLYWMALRIFTPMAVASGSGLKAILEENCVPAGIVEVDDFDDVRPLFEKFTNEPALAENWLQSARASLDRATGVNEMTRGEQATLNRVTGAEFLGRQSSMQVRMKDRLYRFGVTLGRMARFNAALRFQFSDRAALVNIAGLDPFTAYNRRTLLTGMQADYIYAPASASPEAGLQAQQITDLAKFLGEMGALVPGGQGMMQLTMRALQAMRIPGAQELAKALAGDVKVSQQTQQLQQQLTQAQEQLKLVAQENDLLRRKLPQPLPPAAELAAELEVSKAAAPPDNAQEEAQEPAGTPEGGEGEVPEGVVE